MEYIKYQPERLYKRFTPFGYMTYNLQIFDNLSPYMNTMPLDQYIDASDQNRLKNLLKYISNNWERVKRDLSHSTSYQKSSYANLSLPTLDHSLTHQEWEQCINHFVQNDLCLSLFVVKSIMLYVFPD